MSAATQKLERTTFTYPRSLEYFDINELQVQTGQAVENFPSVIVKELVDNALDECENSDVTPKVKLAINELDDDKLEIIVTDNGRGIPAETVKKILDFNTRTTSKAFYRTPTRGLMGNALKTIIGIPYALSLEKDTDPIIIESQNVKHVIDVEADLIGDPNVLYHTEKISNNIGTRTTVVLELESNYITPNSVLHSIEKLCMSYGIFNPHINFELHEKMTEYDGETEINRTYKYPPIADTKWRKFYTTDLPSPHWFKAEDLKQLINKHIKSEKIKPFGEFIRDFRGLSHTAKAKKIKNNFPDIKTIADIKDSDTIENLLDLMQELSKPPPPEVLGIIGKENFKKRIEDIYEIDQFWYSRKKGSENDIPYIVEAVGITTKKDTERQIIAGLNFTPTYDDPFKNTYIMVAKKNEVLNATGLSGLLSRLKIYDEDNFILIVHLTYPALEFTDRAKSTVILEYESMIKDSIGEAVCDCCYEYYQHKKREERDAIKEENRINKEREEREKAERDQKSDLKEVVFKTIPEAVYKVSSGNQLPFPNRNLFYVLRDLTKEYNTKKDLRSAYCSGLVKKYQKENGVVIEGLYYEARGEFSEPHTEIIIPLGTREVNNYEPPEYLFNKILYVEKRGFTPIFKATKLAERYDMGIASSKGYAVEACKELLRKANRKNRTDVIILHDCDNDGLMIKYNLEDELAEYNINVIDIGLFVSEVLEQKLEIDPEPKISRKKLQKRLRDTLPQEEQDFLQDMSNEYNDSKGRYWKGHRVELNALTPSQLIAYVEKKLEENNLTKKVCPPDDKLEEEMEKGFDKDFNKKLEDCILEIIDIKKVKREIISKLIGDNKKLIDEVDLSGIPDYIKDELKGNPPDLWSDILINAVEEEVDEYFDDNNGSIKKFIKNAIFGKRKFGNS